MIKKLYRFYSFFMKLLGYDYQISKFIQDLNLQTSANCKILDIGCGTGTLGIKLLKKFPGSTLLATDIQEKFLYGIHAKIKKEGISNNKVTTGISNINTPNKVNFLDGSLTVLKKELFDIICVGGVIGYSKNQRETLKTLLTLIKPGGYLIDLEINKNNLVGRYIAHKYKYNIMPWTEMKDLIDNEESEIFNIPLHIKYFPLNITRRGIIIKKGN